MTKFLKTIFTILFAGSSFFLFAQVGPPPPPGESSGGTNTTTNKTGGGAPIGGGLFILLGLGAAYGGKKIYKLKKENLEE
jgi:hypothetical protein